MILCTSTALTAGQVAELARQTGYSVVVGPVSGLKQTDCEPVEIVLTFGNYEDPLSEADIMRLPRLRWVHSMSSGIEQLPLACLTKRDVLLTSSRGVQAAPISEFVMTMMLYAAKRLSRFAQCQRRREWDDAITTGELQGATLGIIGAGSIGSAVAKKAQAFGMRVLGVNRSGHPSDGFDEMGQLGDLCDMLPQCDYVCISLPSTDETKGLIHANLLNAMKPGVVLVNVGRGDLVVESDLLAAVDLGKVAFAALDVFETEPLPEDHPFWTRDSVFVTSHAASRTPAYVPRVMALFVQNAVRFQAGAYGHMLHREL